MAELYPDTMVASTNVSGSIEFLQNNNTADWYNAVDGTTDTAIQVGMQAPAGELSGTQSVTFHLRADQPDRVPTAAFFMYENGSQVQQLGTSVDVPETGGTSFTETFDASALSDTSGAGVEFRVEGSATGGPQNQRTTIEYGFITWDAQAQTELVTVTSDPATSVTETSATLNGSLDELSGADSADVWFEWGEEGAGFPNSTTVQTLTATGPFDDPISGLTGATTYEFRTQATTTEDSSTGSTLTFTTSEPEAVTVSTGSASDVSDTTATLNGSLDELSGVDSADVWFDWREAGATTWSNTQTQTVTATGSFSEPISGLTETTDYEFRAQASTTNESSTGTTTTFTTTESPRVVAGTVTLDGSGVGGVPVHIINTTPSPSEHLATVTTEADGSFSYETTVSGELHVATQYDDGTTQYNAPSHHSIQ